MWSPREAARLAAEQKTARSNRYSTPSLGSTLDKKGSSGKTRETRRGGRSEKTRCGNADGDGCTRTGCCEPVAILSLARKEESSSNFDSPSAAIAFEAYSGEKVSLAVTETTNPKNLQKNIAAIYNEYARTGPTRCMAVHWKEVGLKQKSGLLLTH